MFSGTPALTSRGMKENNFIDIVGFMDEAINISIDVKSKTGKRFQTMKCNCINNWHLRKYAAINSGYIIAKYL